MLNLTMGLYISVRPSRKWPGRPSENADFTTRGCGYRGNSTGMTLTPTRVSRPGRPSERQHWPYNRLSRLLSISWPQCRRGIHDYPAVLLRCKRVNSRSPEPNVRMYRWLGRSRAGERDDARFTYGGISVLPAQQIGTIASDPMGLFLLARHRQAVQIFTTRRYFGKQPRHTRTAFSAHTSSTEIAYRPISCGEWNILHDADIRRSPWWIDLS